MSPATPRTITELLRERARTGAGAGYAFYAEGRCDAAVLSHRQLWDEVERLASVLHGFEPGERVLIALPSGPDFVRAFFATLHAGLVAVPIPELRAGPRSGLRRRSLGVIADAQPVAAFLPAELHGRERDALPGVTLLSAELSGLSLAPVRAGTDLAVLQYSSGTGGRPKGVMLSHRAVLANLEAIRVAFGHTSASRGLTWLPPYHDMGLIGGLLQPLYADFPVCVMPTETFGRNPLRWLEAISQFGATTSGGPSSAFEACARAAARADRRRIDLGSWEVAFVGAEPVHAESLERFEAAFGPFGLRPNRFLPCYGLAEHTLLATAHRRGEPMHARGAPRAVVSCGAPPPGDVMLVVDPDTGAAVPEGAVGEVWLSGPSTGAGYFGDPARSAETFTARSPGAPDRSFLRTGDLGFVADGELYLTGRRKNLIIVNGQNHQPELIEEHLAETDGVEAVLVFGTTDLPSRVVALVEVDHRRPPGELAALPARLRRAVAEEFELPLHEVCLLRRGALHRTSSGKLSRIENADRHRQGALEPLSISTGTTASSSEELRGLEVMAEELGVEAKRCAEVRSLAELGVDSLRAAALQTRLEAELGLRVSLVDLLTTTPMEALANAESRPTEASAPEAEPINRTQRSIWFADQLDPGVGSFNVGATVRVLRPLDLARLDEAVRSLVSESPLWGARFEAAGGAVERRLEPDPTIDVEGVTEVGSFFARPFDLKRSPPLRVGTTPEGEGFRLHVVAHHLVADFGSVATSIEDLVAAYVARLDGRPPARRASGPTSRRPTERADGPEIELTRLPTDHPRGPWTWQMGSAELELEPELGRRLAETAARFGVTEHAWICGAMLGLVSRYSGEDEVAIAVPFSARPTWRGVGCDVELAPLGASLGSRALPELAGELTRKTAARLEGRAGSRLRARPELPAASIVFAHYPAIDSEPGTHRVEAVHDGAAIFEAFFADLCVDGRRWLRLRYARDLFEAETARALLTNFRALLRASVEHPHVPVAELPLGRGAARGPGVERPLGSTWFGADFLARAHRTPERVALVDGTRHLSYRHLAERALAVADRLRQAGVSRETIVGVHLPRSASLVVGLLGVLLRGAAYLPLDPRLPDLRLETMLGDARARFLLTDGAGAKRFARFAGTTLEVDAGGGATAPAGLPAVHPEQLAYVLYTSGSTGAPKGVAIRHEGVSNLMAWSGQVLPERAQVLAATSVGFDLSVFELFAPLLHGGTVLLADSIGDVVGLPARQAITVINTVPSALQAVRAALPSSVGRVQLAGEPLPLGLVQDLFRGGHVRAVANLYGPSEDTTYSTHAELGPNVGVVSIGGPLPGREGAVDDRSGEVPDGMPGELLLSGPGLARGYLSAPRETATRFRPRAGSTRPGQRWYHTGDRVHRSAAGTYRFHGRIDRQLKLRGFRIELGEIEHVLTGADVERCVALVDEPGAATARLLAFVVCQPGASEPAALEGARRRAVERLPHYMVPAGIFALDALPVTPNGKLDRRALLARAKSAAALPPSGEKTAPRTALQAEVLGAWRELLRVPELGVDDHLFSAGADSLLVLRFIASARDRFGVELSVREAFAAPRVTALAALIEEKQGLDAALLDRIEAMSDEEALALLARAEEGRE